MSRPASRGSTSASPILPQLNNVVRRSRALLSTPSSRRSSTRPSSRSSSRGRRNSLTEEYKRRSISADRAKTFDDMIAQAGGIPRQTKIRRWDGNCRTTTNWDFLRKDPELWFPNGDTFVHLYSEGHSRRGPSLRLCLADIEANNCRPLLEKTCSRPVPESPPLRSRDRTTRADYFLPKDNEVEYELFIPAPSTLSREDAMDYHLTTRNFFAWMFEKPLVGVQLGGALTGLRRRMDEWRPDPEENEDDFLAYIDEQGYTDFRDCPDHALAVLHWAETFRHSELWTDAFVHCVGMNEQLVSSNEFSRLSRTTLAIITRANLEMAVRIDRASVALATFLEEDDVINSEIRLSDPALKHMQRFRSFLHSFYVQRHGYWPPHIVQSSGGRIRPLHKHTFLAMYADFRNLYEFLVDAFADPCDQFEGARSLLNVVRTMDERHKFSPLPHLLPLLPDQDFDPAEQRRQSVWFSLFGNRKAKQAKRTLVATSLATATNVSDMKVVSSAMVREYALFEREYTLKENDRISANEARMARWTLIYALLQTIISVTNAPEEVRDVEGVDYPLCCQTAGTPPWKFSKPSTTSVATTVATGTQAQKASTGTSPTRASTKYSAPSAETLTPATTPSESAMVSPLDLDYVDEKRSERRNEKRKASQRSPSSSKVTATPHRSATTSSQKTTTSPFPRSSALRPPIPPRPTDPEMSLLTATPPPVKSAKRSRIPVPVPRSQTSTPLPSTPPPIQPRSNARAANSRHGSLKSPQPRRPLSGVFLDIYNSDATSTSIAPTTTAYANTIDFADPNPSPTTSESDSPASLARSTPTLEHDSDDARTTAPSSRSERTGGAITPIAPPSPSIYGAVSIADSSDRELDVHHRQRSNSSNLGHMQTFGAAGVGRAPASGNREKVFASQRASMKSANTSTRTASALRNLSIKASRSTGNLASTLQHGRKSTDSKDSKEAGRAGGLRSRAGSASSSALSGVGQQQQQQQQQQLPPRNRKYSHKRDRSSELAQMFRKEIRWREGPGWDWEVEGILKGKEEVTLGEGRA